MFLNDACENENLSSRLLVVEPRQLTLLFRNRLKSDAFNYRKFLLVTWSTSSTGDENALHDNLTMLVNVLSAFPVSSPLFP